MRFRLRSWNCFGTGQSVMDAIAWRAPLAERLLHTDVRKTCGDADVLCLQEILSHHAESFFDSVGDFASRHRDDNRPTLWPTSFRGSGLGIAARTALVRPSVWPFRAPGIGWDKLARKGAMHAQLILARGPTVDILSTHLQAGDRQDAMAVRARQLRELAQLVTTLGSPERPFIVCGDFNIDGLARARKTEEYQGLVNALDGFEDLGAASDLPTFEPHPSTNALAHAFEPFGRKRRIDYVFFRPASQLTLTHKAVERLFDRPLSSVVDPHKAYASDHFGLCITFEYEPR